MVFLGLLQQLPIREALLKHGIINGMIRVLVLPGGLLDIQLMVIGSAEMVQESLFMKN